MSGTPHHLSSLRAELDQLQRELIDAWHGAAAELLGHKYLDEVDAEEASLLLLEAHHYVASTLMLACEYYLHADPWHPRFLKGNAVQRRGLDNPDNLYLHAVIDPGESYRIRGRLPEAEDVSFQIWDNLGRIAVASLHGRDLAVDGEGRFEILVTSQPPPAGAPAHLANHLRQSGERRGDTLLVRYTFGAWKESWDQGELHLDCPGGEGLPAGPLDLDRYRGALRRIAAYVREDATYWVRWAGQLKAMLPENLLPPIRLLGGDMGLSGLQYNTMGVFHLRTDEALLVTLRESSAGYLGFQLGNLWFQGLDYKRQTSLSREQAVRSADGLYRYVVSPADPGIANWLDPQGHRTGFMLLRYQCIPAGAELRPETDGPLSCVVTKLEALPALFPVADRENAALFFPPPQAAARRFEQIARRQRHLQRRFDY